MIKTTTTTNHAIAMGIHEQLMGEAEALHDYEEFLAENKGLLPADIDIIHEIEMDEKNHQILLLAMAKRYDGSIAASPDDIASAVNQIIEGIGNVK